MRKSLILWLQDAIPHDEACFAYFTLLLLDDHSDQSNGRVAPELRSDLQSFLHSVSFTSIPLPSFINYLAENQLSVIILLGSSLSLIPHLVLQHLELMGEPIFSPF